jgi:hypothetical protein
MRANRLALICVTFVGWAAGGERRKKKFVAHTELQLRQNPEVRPISHVSD